MTGISSREVNSSAVIGLLAPHLGVPGLIPGTPDWCQRDDTDPAKWEAILRSSVWWAIDEEGRQAAMVDASRDVAEAVDCESVARGVLRQDWRRTAGVYVPREVA